ncbi:MAG: S4 domain-containing protein [Acidobacteriota bacterium]
MDEMQSLRLDIWLDVACLFKTRSQAQNACQRGRVDVNGQNGKPHRAIRPGDRINISMPGGGKRIVVVKALTDKHIPRAQARELFDDLTPKPTPEELELRKLQRLSTPAPRVRGAGAPKKKERRQLRRAKEGWGEE